MARRKRILWLAALGALGAGIGYAQHRGWLAHAFARLEHPASSHEQGQGGVGMRMPGMGGGQTPSSASAAAIAPFGKCSAAGCLARDPSAR